MQQLCTTSNPPMAVANSTKFLSTDSVLSTAPLPGEAANNGNDAHRGEQIQPQPQLGYSDLNLASRKANEAAGRRFQAASWLQKMVGPSDIPAEPTEEEFRQCLRNGLVLCNLINKIHPGAVPKIVENPTFSVPPLEGAPLSAYQYFENVRNFLVAVEELHLPSFEASDLDEGASPTGLPVKVVDCILSLKAYHEWQQAGGHGPWKLNGPLKYPFLSKLSTKSSPGASQGMNQANVEVHSIWAPGGPKEIVNEFCNQSGKSGSHQVSNGHFPHEELENGWSSFDSSAGWVHQVCQKFVEVYLAKRKSSHEAYGVQDMNMPCEALLHLVMMVLHDKQPVEVPVVVEFLLKKVIEESEQRFLGQARQLKRSHSKGAEDHGHGSLEEKKQTLQREIQRLRSMDNRRAYRMDLQRDELQELRLALGSLRLECRDAQLGWEEEMEGLNTKMQGLAQAAAEYHKVAAENRELYNQVQDLRGSIRVYCRVRPFLPGQNITQNTVDFIGEKGSITIANPTKPGKDQKKSFVFNKVFGPSARQEEIFLDTQPLIRSVLDGYNVCIFAYGQTGSGKTYTMTGPNNPSSKDWGVNFRALHDLFELAQYRNDLVCYEVGVQMIEIYNEQVRDLLCTDGSNKKLEIRNNSQQNGLNVPDASMVSVNSTEDVLDLMRMGHKNRAVGSTALNDRSSRSHSVLTVHIKGKELASGAVLRGCLHLVDLAGSERVDKSEATGDRLKEAQHINKSLSALGDVIAALAQKSAHVPYRNSKLTQLLQDSLGGQAKTLMFVHVSPDAESHGETLSTLKFAERVALVELGAAHSHKESGDVRELKEQVSFLKDLLAKKDGDLERIQKESQSKAISDNSREKPRVKTSHETGSLHGHGQGNRRQPLEEVRNAEVRQIQNGVSSLDFRMDHSTQPRSPLGHHATFYDLSREEETAKRKASGRVLRDRIMSPPQTTNHGMSRNKIQYDHSTDEGIHQYDLHNSRSTPPHDVLSVHVGRNGFTYRGRPNGCVSHEAREQVHQQNGHTNSMKSPPYNTGSHSPLSASLKHDSRRDHHVHHRRSNSYSYMEGGDCSTEGSTSRHDEFDEYEEEEEGISDFSDAERWQKEADLMSPCSLREDASQNTLMMRGKGRPVGDRRNTSSNQQQGGVSLAKTAETNMSSSTRKLGGSPKNGQMHTRFQRYPVEPKKARGKATSVPSL